MNDPFSKGFYIRYRERIGEMRLFREPENCKYSFERTER